MTTTATTRVDTTIDLLHDIATGPLGDDLRVASDRLCMLVLHRAHRDDVELSLSELAQSLWLSKAAVTALADRMEAKGFAKRRPDHMDRRRSVFTITRAGIKAVDAAFDSLVVTA